MATEAVMKKNRPHTRYYVEVDGKKVRVPGVTTIIGVLDKPALKYWGNKIGLQGISIREYVDETADIGSCAHYLIGCELKEETPDLSEYAPAAVAQAENGYLKFLDWRESQGSFELIGSEMQVVSAEHMYGGTADIYCKINGRPTLIDIKTSGSGIYPEMMTQAAAYTYALREMGHPVDQAIIVRVGRSEDEGFETAVVTAMEKRFELFLHCREIYELQKQLKAA